MHWRVGHLAVSAAALGLLAGCSLAPRYRTPATPVPAQSLIHI